MLMLTKDTLKQANSDKGDSPKACFMKYKYRNIFLKQRCITSTSQSTQVHTRPHARIHTIKLVPTQQWLFLLAQTINCHSLELAILNRIFLEYIPFAQAFKKSNTFFQRFFFFYSLLLGSILTACVQKRN